MSRSDSICTSSAVAGRLAPLANWVVQTNAYLRPVRLWSLPSRRSSVRCSASRTSRRTAAALRPPSLSPPSASAVRGLSWRASICGGWTRTSFWYIQFEELRLNEKLDFEKTKKNNGSQPERSGVDLSVQSARGAQWCAQIMAVCRD